MSMAPSPHRTGLGAALAALTVAACAVDDLPSAPTARSSAAAITPSPYHVTSLADDGGEGTLRKEIADAGPGEIVTIDESLAGQTIVLTQGQIELSEAVTVLGPEPGTIIIDLEGQSRAFDVPVGTGLTLEDVTITRGADGDGGAIRSFGGLTLERVTITASDGSPGSGGAIMAVDGLVLRDSRIVGNRAEQAGGGIYTAGGPVTISGTTVADNEVTEFGGKGGGLWLVGGPGVNITHSTISGNTATFGGGIRNDGAILTITNSTVSGNDAENNGGGIHAANGEVTLDHATVAANTSGGGGGFLWLAAVTDVTLRNSIIAGNTDNDPSAHDNCWIDGDPDLEGRNLSNDASCGSAGPAMIVADAVLGGLADNGGATETHAPQFGSPAIDGAPSCTLDDDQRGVARPQGSGCDIGAVEFDDYVVPEITIDASGTVNKNTGVAVVSGTTACRADAPLTLRVTVTQEQRVRRVKTVVTGSAEFTAGCGTAGAWAAAVTPATGAFTNSAAAVHVEVITHPAWVTPVSAEAPSVVFAWTRR